MSEAQKTLSAKIKDAIEQTENTEVTVSITPDEFDEFIDSSDSLNIEFVTAFQKEHGIEITYSDVSDESEGELYLEFDRNEDESEEE